MNRKERALREARRKKRNRIIIAFAVLAAIVFVIAVLPKPAFDYNFCGASGTAQRLTFGLFIRVGDAEDLTTQFIPIPERTGVRASCSWPMQTGSKNVPGDYGNRYTLIYVFSKFPASDHRYSLSDFFEGWSVYFGKDGVSKYRTADFELLVNGVHVDNDTFYRPRSGDLVDLLLHQPFWEV